MHDQTAKVVIMAAFRALGLPRADCVRGATEALHALDKAKLVVVSEAEIDALRHDLDRYITIASDLATEQGPYLVGRKLTDH